MQYCTIKSFILVMRHLLRAIRIRPVIWVISIPSFSALEAYCIYLIFCWDVQVKNCWDAPPSHPPFFVEIPRSVHFMVNDWWDLLMYYFLLRCATRFNFFASLRKIVWMFFPYLGCWDSQLENFQDSLTNWCRYLVRCKNNLGFCEFFI